MSAPISIINGQYSKNGGAYTSANGTIDNGDTLRVRAISSLDFDDTTTTIVTVGEYSTNFNITTKSEVGNERRSQTFQRNNCASGSSGTFYEYVVEANTYFAPTLAEANALADEDIADNGQNAANTNGTCILDTVISVFFVDVLFDSASTYLMRINTPGIDPSINNVSVISGANFFRNTDPAENAFMLASDLIDQSNLMWRFAGNIGKLINLYPDAVAVPQFIFELMVNTGSLSIKNGRYSLKYPNQTLIMNGTVGSYIPSTSPTGGPTPTDWSGTPSMTGTTVVLKTFTYNRSTNTIIVT